MLEFQFAFFVVSLCLLAAATYTDIKARIVPNKLVYGAALLGIFLKAAESFFAGSLWPIALALQGCAAAFALGYLLYKIGVWAGGDVKLLAVLGLLNPVNYGALQGLFGISFFSGANNALPLFGASIVIYSALAVFPLGMLMSLTAIFRHAEIMEKVKKVAVRDFSVVLGAACLYSGLGLAMQSAEKMNIFPALANPAFGQAITLALIAIVFFAPQKARNVLMALFGIAGTVFGGAEFAIGAITAALPIAAIYLLWAAYSESKAYAFRETKNVSDLAEGDVPDKIIVEHKGKVEFVDVPSVKSVINKFIGNKIESSLEGLKAHGRIIADPRQAGGISAEDAKELKRLAAKGKAPREITVRRTMAFVPALLVAYVALQFTGDVLWLAFA